MTYSKEAMEFSTTECVICIDPFGEHQKILRIPTCRHYFHPDCLKKWFESKAQEDEQRCPQCNTTLKTEEMKRKKAENAIASLGFTNSAQK
jgi:hypothetical protein